MVANSIMHQIMAWENYAKKQQKKERNNVERIRVRSYPDPERPGLYFTYREIEIIQLLSSGLTYRQTGSIMNVSDRTIECHVRHMRIKTGLTDRFALIAQAKCWGIIH